MIKPDGRNKTAWISKEIKNLKKAGLFNTIRTIDSPIGAHIKVDGKRVLNFCSNNYLGLANHPKLRKAAIKAISKYGVGTTAVRTISGTTKLHIELEKKLAKFKKSEAVVTFQSGYCANLATIPALVGKGDVIFSDELNHASIIDGCRLSKAEVVRYKHVNPQDLKEKIKSFSKVNRKLIVSDGVFSMDGDIAPLDKLYQIANKYNALLMIDDAHGEGVLGKGGRGIVDHFDLHGKVDIEIGTLSKAFGVIGGFATGKKEVADWLKLRGRPFLFSNAMTIPDVAAAIAAVAILEKSENKVKKLWDNTNYFKNEMKNMGFDIGKSVTPITPVMLGDVKLAQQFSKLLFNKGVFAVALGYPTVAHGKARIRVMISAAHTKKNLDKALDSFKKVGKKLKVMKLPRAYARGVLRRGIKANE